MGQKILVPCFDVYNDRPFPEKYTVKDYIFNTKLKKGDHYYIQTRHKDNEEAGKYLKHNRKLKERVLNFEMEKNNISDKVKNYSLSNSEKSASKFCELSLVRTNWTSVPTALIISAFGTCLFTRLKMTSSSQLSLLTKVKWYPTPYLETKKKHQ